MLVKRANPVLRDVDRLFGILSAQRDQLAQLASDSETILRPARARARPRRRLPRQRRRRRPGQLRTAAPQLEASLRKFPRFLREFRLTMRSLQGFSDAATPVFADLGKAAPSLTDATRTLTPFSRSDDGGAEEPRRGRRSLRPDLPEADPIVRKARDLAKSGVVADHANWRKLFASLKKTRGWDGLVELIYNTTASLNGFDQYGHFGRTLVTLTNCLDYEPTAIGTSGCAARFNGPNAAERSRRASSRRPLPPAAARSSRNEDRRHRRRRRSRRPPSVRPARAGRPKRASPAPPRPGGTAPLLNYLLGP